jgi:tetratricopeptide (TPR) repeat protein
MNNKPTRTEKTDFSAIILVIYFIVLLVVFILPVLSAHLAQIYLEQENYQASVNASSVGIWFLPKDTALHWLRAAAYKGADKPNLALEDINYAITGYLEDTEYFEDEAWAFYSLRGRINHDLENLPEALKDFDQAIALYPNPDTYFNRSLVYMDLGAYDKALEDLSTILTIDESYAVAYYNRGILYTGLYDFEKAKSDISRALELYQEQKLPEQAEKAQNILDEINDQ